MKHSEIVATWSPAYRKYHADVVEACVERSGEKDRRFWNEECDYFEEFAKNEDPKQVADDQMDAL